MKKSTYFLDCEFDGHNGPLLSIALINGVNSASRAYGIPSAAYFEADNVAKDPWVINHVVPLLGFNFVRDSQAVTPRSFKDMWEYSIRETRPIPTADIGHLLREYLGLYDDENKHITFVSDCAIDFKYLIEVLQTGQNGEYHSLPDVAVLTFRTPIVPDHYFRKSTNLPDHHALVDAYNLRYAYLRMVLGYV